MANDNSSVKRPRIPSTLDQLRDLILKYAKKGVNVAEAWSIYGDARKAEKEAGEKGPEVPLSVSIEKAYGDLERKKSLRWYSNIAIFLGFLFVASVIAGAVLILKKILPYHKLILGVPLSVVFWGLIGSTSYVLMTEYPGIRDKALDLYGLIRYGYRFILGGFLAAVVFFIIQLGVVSFPGAAGDEVFGAVEIAEARENYYVADAKMRKLTGELQNIRSTISAFENALDGNLEDKCGALLTNEDEWAKLADDYKLKDLDGNPINRTNINSHYNDFATVNKEYEDVRVVLEDYATRIYVAVTAAREKALKERRAPAPASETAALEPPEKKYDELLGNLEKADLEVKIDLLLSLDNRQLWEKAPFGKKEVVTYELLEDGWKTYREKKIGREEARVKCDTDFKSVSAKLLPKLQEDEEKKSSEWAEADRDVRNAGACLPRYQIQADLDKTKVAIKEMDEEIKDWESILENPSVKELSPQTEAYLWEKVHAKRSEKKDKEKERDDLDTQLRDALRAELRKPIWESPLFVVIAFLAGYSVEFADRLFKRLQDFIVEGITARRKPEGGGPGEEEGGKSEASGSSEGTSG